MTMLGLFSVSNDVSVAGEDQAGIRTFVKGRLVMMEPTAGTPSPDWQWNGVKDGQHGVQGPRNACRGSPS